MGEGRGTKEEEDRRVLMHKTFIRVPGENMTSSPSIIQLWSLKSPFFSSFNLGSVYLKKCIHVELTLKA